MEFEKAYICVGGLILALYVFHGLDLDVYFSESKINDVEVRLNGCESDSCSIKGTLIKEMGSREYKVVDKNSRVHVFDIKDVVHMSHPLEIKEGGQSE